MAVTVASAKKPKTDPVKFSVGIHTGFDIGAAVPWPPGEAVGGGNKMSAVPRLSPALGFSYTTIFNKHWMLTVESTYKTVAMDAKTWVKSQLLYLKDANGNVEGIQQFRGTAEAKMSFTMLEVPLYLKYTFRKGYDKVFLGGYYAYVIKGRFETIPKKGTITELSVDPPHEPTPDSTIPVTPESAVVQNFDSSMDSWDAGFILGYERKLTSRVNLSGRFSMGFKDVFKPEDKYLDYAMLHMRGTVVLSYTFMRK